MEKLYLTFNEFENRIVITSNIPTRLVYMCSYLVDLETNKVLKCRYTMTPDEFDTKDICDMFNTLAVNPSIEIGHYHTNKATTLFDYTKLHDLNDYTLEEVLEMIKY